MRKFYLLIILVCLVLTSNKLSAQAIPADDPPPCVVDIARITTQLTCTTTSILLTASGPGTPDEMTYTWKFKPSENEPEEETAVSLITTCTATRAGIYTVYGNGAACGSASGAVTITKVPPIALAFTASAFPSVVCAGIPTTLVALGPIDYTYEWHSNDDPSKVLPGSQVTVNPLTSTTYTVTSKDVNGCPTVRTVDVLVSPSPSGSIGGDNNVCKDVDPPLIGFTGSTSKKPLVFAYSINGGKTQTIQTYDDTVGIEAPTRLIGTYNYTLLSVTDGNACTQSYSAGNTAVIMVADKGILTSDKTARICADSVFHYQAKSSVDGTAFSWTRPVVPGISTQSKDNGTTSIIDDTLHNLTSAPIIVTYFFTLSTGGSCVTKEQVAVTVNPTPVMDTIRDKDAEFCNGTFVSAGIPFKSSKFPDAQFTWTADNTDIGLPQSTGVALIPPFIATDTSRVTKSAKISIVIKSGTTGCTSNGPSFNITVFPAAVFTSAKTKTICDNTDFNYRATISPSASTYNWMRLPFTNVVQVSGVDSLKSDSVSQHIHNTTLVPQVVSYVFNLSAGFGCEIRDTVRVLVNPTPIIGPIGNKIYCNRDYVAGGIAFTSKTPESSFTWTNDNTNIGLLSSSGIGNILPFNATNTTDSNIRAHITVSVKGSADQCPGADSTFTIVVRPAPVLTSQKTEVICDSSLFTETVTSSAIATVFNWTRYPVTGISNDTGRGNTALISERLDNTDSIPRTVNYIFRLSIDTGCVSLDTLKVTVNPTPVITPLRDTTFCNGDAVNGINFTSKTDSVSFNWTASRTVGFGTAGSVRIPTFIATNPDTAAIVAKVRVAIAVGKNDQCHGQDTSFNITVNPSPPKPEFTSFSRYPDNNILPLCDSSENINFNVNAPARGVTYNWTSLPGSRQSVPIRDLNDANTVISFRNPGTYTISVTATKKAVPTDPVGCISTVSQIVQVKNRTLGIDKRKIFKMEPDNLLIYPNNSIPGYQWGYDSVIRVSPDSSFGPPVPIPGQVYQFFIPAAKFLNNDKTLNEKDYLYWVLLNNDSCSTRIYYNGPYANRVIDIAPVDSTVKLQIMPNPNSGSFQISLKGNIYGNINAQVYNGIGQVVYKQNFVKGDPSVIEKINTSHLPGGLYFLILNSNDGKKITSRFIIQR